MPSKNKNKSADLQAEVERLRHRLDQLSALGRDVASSLEPMDVLSQVVRSACELTDAKYGALGIFDEHGTVIDFITHGISPDEIQRIGDYPKGLGILGWLHELSEPVRLSDLAEHPRSVGFPPNHPPMKNFLGAPIRAGDKALGNLYLTEKLTGPEFTEEDQHLLVLFVAQAAMAINNARVFEAEHQARARLEAVVDTSPAGIFVVEADGRKVVLTNKEVDRIVSIPAQGEAPLAKYEATISFYRPDGTKYDPRDLPLQRALDSGETTRAEEVVFERADGSRINTLVNASPIKSPEGELIGAITVIQDMTPLDQIERLRNEFLGLVTHELKTPLTAIKGAAATILGADRPLDPPEINDLMEIVDEQSDRLRDLIDNLLDVSRIEAGVLSVRAEATELRDILEEALTLFARSSGGRQVEVRAEGELPTVNADRRRIGQVIGNLLTNAGKFSESDEVITIGVVVSQGQVTIDISDEGQGIPAEALPHVFKKFYQFEDESTGRGKTGSGLGLAICKGIVEAHGGRIWAESTGTGAGTTIGFTLPMAERPAAPAAAPAQPARPAGGKVQRTGPRLKILAVDDEPQVLRIIKRNLEDGGYRVVVTSDAEGALSMVETEEPDMVLLDLMLQGTTGLEVLRRIREFSGVPVIFLSSRAKEQDVVQALRAGADDYILKPFAPSELLARIEAALRRRVRPDELEAVPPFVLEDLAIDFARRDVTIAGEHVSLTATEYKLLYELATHAGRVLTHDQILQRVWGPEYSGESQLVRSFVRNLRRKLGDDAKSPRYILTEPQVGYRVADPR
jgi:DNA-binding response OmpR family regulator/signal transduction histidine kinase